MKWSAKRKLSKIKIGAQLEKLNFSGNKVSYFTKSSIRIFTKILPFFFNSEISCLKREKNNIFSF